MELERKKVLSSLFRKSAQSADNPRELSTVRAEIFNRQRGFSLDLERLERLASAACGACLLRKGTGCAVLGQLEAVEVSIVSDRVIAQVHRRFLNLPGPTDVITFEHGEVIVRATTAARRALQENEPLDREVARYIVHGILHLNGHLDELPAEAAKMWQAQEAVLRSLWPLP